MRQTIPLSAAAFALILAACGPAADYGAAPPEDTEGAAGVVEPLETYPDVELEGDPAYKDLPSGAVRENAPEAAAEY